MSNSGMAKQRDRSHAFGWARRVVVTLVAVASGLLVVLSGPANAATASNPDPGTVTVTVHMYVQNSRALPSRAVAPDGTGPIFRGDCGTAQLTVNARTHKFLIELNSTRGNINDGVYTITTNGILNSLQLGFISTQGRSTRSKTLGTIGAPGIFSTAAFADGVVFTTQAVCGFVAVAPWN